MDFIGKVVATMEVVGKEVTDKTKEVADNAKLNIQIKEAESDLKKCYEKIGKQFYSETKDTPYPEYADLFENIAKLERQIKTKKEELAAGR